MVETVSAQVKVLEDAAESLLQAVSSVGADAESAAEAASNATGSAQAVAVAAEALTTAITEIGKEVAHSTEVARRAVGLADETQTVVAGLSETATSIGQVVEMIGGIAAQTNLLALNATIEAARAGEAGRGFAVVAGAVKTLATQTASSTNEITAQIEAIQTVSQTAARAIDRVAGTIHEISDVAQKVTTAVQGQMASTNEIAANIQGTARASEVVTDRMVSVLGARSRSELHAQSVKSTADTLTVHVCNLQQSLTRVVRTATTDSDRRAHERHACTVATVVRPATKGTFEALIVDVSRGGLRLADPGPLRKGETVSISLTASGFTQRAVVRSVNSAGAHLAFSQGDIAEADVEAILAGGAVRAA